MKEKESILSGHLQPTRHDTRCFNFYKKVAIINTPILQKMKMTLKMINLFSNLTLAKLGFKFMFA